MVFGRGWDGKEYRISANAALLVSSSHLAAHQLDLFGFYGRRSPYGMAMDTEFWKHIGLKIRALTRVSLLLANR